MYNRMRRATVVAVTLLILGPTAWWIGQMGNRTKLWADDSLEERECRQCDGGRAQPDPAFLEVPMFDGKCPFCSGTGRVQVIVPGVHRPTRIKVLVVDGTQIGPYATYWSLRKGSASGLGRGDPMRPFCKPPGAIGGAALHFSRLVDDEWVPDRELESNAHGLHTVLLDPGVWRIRVEATGFRLLEGQVEVPVLTAPIWLEKAHLISPPRTEAEARSIYGIEILLALARTAEQDARFEARPGEP